MVLVTCVFGCCAISLYCTTPAATAALQQSLQSTTNGVATCVLKYCSMHTSNFSLSVGGTSLSAFSQLSSPRVSVVHLDVQSCGAHETSRKCSRLSFKRAVARPLLGRAASAYSVSKRGRCVIMAHAHLNSRPYVCSIQVGNSKQSGHVGSLLAPGASGMPLTRHLVTPQTTIRLLQPF